MHPRTPLITDFDGTLTPIAGGALVFTQEYSDVVTNQEMSQALAAHQEACDKISAEVAALETEKERVSSQLGELPFSQQADIETLANSDDYNPQNLGASGEYTPMNLSISGEFFPGNDDSDERQQLLKQLYDIENRIYTLTEQKKKYSSLPYLLMCEQKLTQEQVIVRSKQILEKIQHHSAKDIFKLAKGAKETLLAALADDSIPVYIISKNHEEYIRAVLLFNGISEDLINKITIFDWRKGGGNKYATAGNIFREYPSGTVCVTCDDDRDDSMRMQKAAHDHGMDATSFRQLPGKFDFTTVLQALTKTPTQENAGYQEVNTSGLRKSSLHASRINIELSSDSSPETPRSTRHKK